MQYDVRANDKTSMCRQTVVSAATVSLSLRIANKWKREIINANKLNGFRSCFRINRVYFVNGAVFPVYFCASDRLIVRLRSLHFVNLNFSATAMFRPKFMHIVGCSAAAMRPCLNL